MQVRPARGLGHHAEAAGPLDSLGTAGCSGGVEEHTGVFWNTVGAACKADVAGGESVVADGCYFEGVEREGGVGVVIIAEDFRGRGVGGVVLECGGCGGEELVGC